MAQFALALTTPGRNLLAKAQTGVPLNFTRFGIGSGDWEVGQNPEQVTVLVEEQLSLSFQALEVTGDGTTRLRVVLTNAGLEAGFMMREIGVYADDPDDGEILYMTAYAGDQYDYIPPAAAGPIEKVLDVYVVTGNAGSVTAEISDLVVIAVKQDIEDHNVDPAAHGGIAGMITDALSGFPQATTTVQGKVELATNTETVTGTDTVRAVTPAGDAAALAALLATANSWTAAQVYTPVALSIDAGAVAWDVRAAPVAVLELTEDVTSLTLSNAAPGATYELTLIQDATGGRTVAWPSAWLWPGGEPLEVSADAGAEDLLHLSTRDDDGTTVIRATYGQAMGVAS